MRAAEDTSAETLAAKVGGKRSGQAYAPLFQKQSQGVAQSTLSSPCNRRVIPPEGECTTSVAITFTGTRPSRTIAAPGTGPTRPVHPPRPSPPQKPSSAAQKCNLADWWPEVRGKSGVSCEPGYRTELLRSRHCGVCLAIRSMCLLHTMRICQMALCRLRPMPFRYR